MKNFANMMKQAQELQGRMAEMQAEMERVASRADPAAVWSSSRSTARATWRGVKIDPSLVKPEETEILEDLIVAAHHRCQGQGRER